MGARGSGCRRIEAHVLAADRLHGDDTTVPVISARCRGGLPFRGGSRRSRRCRFDGRGDRPARAGERRRHHRFDRRCVGRRAILPAGALFFGRPGNPLAAYVGFRFFVNSALRAMLGLAEERGVPLSADLPARPGMTLIQKAGVDVDREGRFCPRHPGRPAIAHPAPTSGSQCTRRDRLHGLRAIGSSFSDLAKPRFRPLTKAWAPKMELS